MITQFNSFNFGLGETADMLREAVNAFARDEIAPRAAEIDEANDIAEEIMAAARAAAAVAK